MDEIWIHRLFHFVHHLPSIAAYRSRFSFTSFIWFFFLLLLLLFYFEMMVVRKCLLIFYHLLFCPYFRKQNVAKTFPFCMCLFVLCTLCALRAFLSTNFCVFLSFFTWLVVVIDNGNNNHVDDDDVIAKICSKRLTLIFNALASARAHALSLDTTKDNQKTNKSSW